MHSIPPTISLYRIKKVVAKSFAVLFSVGLIVLNFNSVYGADYPAGSSQITLQPGKYTISYSASFNNSGYGVFSAFGFNDGTFTITDFVNINDYSYDYVLSRTNYSDSYVFTNGNASNSGSFTLDLTSGSCYIRFRTSPSDYVISINDYVAPVPPTTYNYTLQNGWLSVIDFGTSGASYNLTLNTSFAEYSHLSQPWWDSTHRYWFTDTMPTVGSTITNSETGILISWEKTGNTDLFGRSKSAIATISGTASARYMIIYNPAYHYFNSFGSGIREESNLPLSIYGVTQGNKISLFKMDETMHLTNGITSQFITAAGSTVAIGSALNLTDSFEDTDGNSVVQNSGGGNDIHESSGIVSYIVAINDTLDNFTNQFIHLLSAPITHIQQLVASGTNFFNAFGSLFTFLPTTAYDVIIGAFIVMVVIGVIKLLL